MREFERVVNNAAETIRDLGHDKDNPLRIYTVLNHVSKSGLTRQISAYIIHNDEPCCVAFRVRVEGCGSDMGFHLADCIYQAVFPGFFKDRPELYHVWL